jgi:hypothetical protein
MADPSDPSAWPSYQIGPRDSVFALGVASVNYAGLEFVVGYVPRDFRANPETVRQVGLGPSRLYYCRDFLAR